MDKHSGHRIASYDHDNMNYDCSIYGTENYDPEDPEKFILRKLLSEATRGIWKNRDQNWDFYHF